MKNRLDIAYVLLSEPMQKPMEQTVCLQPVLEDGQRNLAGLSDVMLNYGNEGLKQSEALKQLHEQSRIIHRHLAEYFE